MKLSLLLILGCTAVVRLNAADDSPVDFVRQIKPVLAERCVECHNSENLLGNLNLQSRALAMQKRKEGSVIVPKMPEKSPLYLVLTLPPANDKAMPATAHRLPKTDVENFRRWLDEGAHWPEGKEGAVTPRKAKAKEP